jgi:DnaK suppressor protein
VDLASERARTERVIEALTRDLESVFESIEGVGNDDEHDPDGSTIAFERAQLIALLRSARRHLVELDAAEARVAAGTYGRCIACGGPIGDERLAALPTTERCVSCA